MKQVGTISGNIKVDARHCYVSDCTTPSPQLSTSAAGDFLVSVIDSDVSVIDRSVESPKERSLGVAHVRSAVALGDEVWVVAGADLLALHRFSKTGDRAAPPLPLELAGDDVYLQPSPTEALSSAVLTVGEHYSLRADCGTIELEAFRPQPDAIVPVAADEWLITQSGRLGYVRGGQFTSLSASPSLTGDARLVAACTVGEKRALAVFVQGSSPAIWLLDSKRGEVRRRIPLAVGARVTFAAARGHALVLVDQQIRVLDLRFGKVLVEWKCDNPIVDASCDAVGRVVSTLQRSGDELEVAWVEYRELLTRQRGPLTWSSVKPEPPPAPVKPRKPSATTAQTLSKSQQAILPSTSSTNSSLGPHAEDDELLVTSGGIVEPSSYLLPAPSWDVDDAPLTTAIPEIRSTVIIPETLAALRPRRQAEPSTPEQALVALQHQLATVGAWCKLAIAKAWDSGRIGFANEGSFPFQDEVNALLDGGNGLAPDNVASAREQLRAIVELHDQELDESKRGSGNPGQSVSALAEIAREFDLSRAAADILLIAAAPAIWGSMARLYAVITNDEGRPLCDEWLAAHLLSERVGRREVARELDPLSPLCRHGLICNAGGTRPFAKLTVHPLVIRRLYGDQFETDPGDEWVQASAPSLPLDELTLSADLERFVDDLRHQKHSARLVFRGRSGSGRRTLASVFAAVGNRRLGIIDLAAFKHGGDSVSASLQEALRCCEIRGWMPFVVGAEESEQVPGGSDDSVADIIESFDGPLAFRCNAGAAPPIKPGYSLIDLAPLSESERSDAWARALKRSKLTRAPARRLASKYAIGPGTMQQVVSGLSSRVTSSVDQVELYDALDSGIRQHREDRITKLATRVTRLASWSNVVLPDEIFDSVREFIGRVRHKRTVFEQWGFDEVMSSSRGLTALFEGRPGTGKTMVAGLIARELGYDLYRVDLSRILSKWVGETERHLSELFEAAEGGQVILLFDEADSLFAKRTEVKSSNDRFANLAVNYLLQRLDSFEGIAIMTTNFGKSIDPAFKRRLTVRLTFPFPDEELREKIWRAHLPSAMPIAGELDLATMACKYQLSGGYIRNVVLRAAFLAAHESRPFDQSHIERAISLEYRAMGSLTTGGLLE